MFLLAWMIIVQFALSALPNRGNRSIAVLSMGSAWSASACIVLLGGLSSI
jgi:hypothetical protein